ncbi:MAG TPA: TIGR01777 family oxidoreductase [Pyrinomonadaceae bacterium]|nr:TIGR01777 family oxidoreductase [Pyrinomonadaceae bacterium]
MATKHCVLAGGSGFLGTALAAELVRNGYEVVVLTRSPRNNSERIRYMKWDGKALGAWVTALEGAEAVINLTGRSVICRYTPENKNEIVSSRVDSVRAIGDAIETCKRPPVSWVQCGSLAIYGDAGEIICDETAPAGDGFSAKTCIEWEKAFDITDAPSTRKVLLRIGFTLGRNEGALRTLARLTRYYLGGTVGNGRQYISWISMQDLNRMFQWAIERSDIEGKFNATSPGPVRNAEFMRELRRSLGRPWSPPVPIWAVRLGSAVLGIEPELALTGRRCIPRRFQEKHFEFSDCRVSETLDQLFAGQGMSPKARGKS